jgi:hypothetical protein
MSRFSSDRYSHCGCYKKKKRKNNNNNNNGCNGCFCERFSDRTNVTFTRLVIDGVIFQVGENDPLPGRPGNPNINTITLVSISDDCCATFMIAGGMGANTYTYTITADCRRVSIFETI